MEISANVTIVSFMNRIEIIFKKLRNLPIVKEQDFCKDNIREFQKVISESAPTNEAEDNYCKCTRYFYKSDKVSFVKFVNFSKKRFLCLLIDGSLVAKFLKIDKFLKIRWNFQRKLFDIILLPRIAKIINNINSADFEVVQNMSKIKPSINEIKPPANNNDVQFDTFSSTPIPEGTKWADIV